MKNIFVFSVVLVRSLVQFGMCADLFNSDGEDEACPIGPQLSCTSEMIPKHVPAGHPLAKLRGFAGREQFICSPPACLSRPCLHNGVCEETMDGFKCSCPDFASGLQCETLSPIDCQDIMLDGFHTSGVYSIFIDGAPTQVYCDMETDGGGWLVFQRRFEGTVGFYRTWADYKTGFGDVEGEFWLGNDNLHILTSQKNYALRVDLEDWRDNKAYAEYSSFTVGSEQTHYHMKTGSYTGTAGDSFLYVRRGANFSTRGSDNDNDDWRGGQCAETHRGGWWYTSCGETNLNGRYYNYLKSTNVGEGNWWVPWTKIRQNLKKSDMKIRPKP